MPDPPAALKAGLTIHMQCNFLMQLYLYNWIFQTYIAVTHLWLKFTLLRSKTVNRTPPERGGGEQGGPLNTFEYRVSPLDPSTLPGFMLVFFRFHTSSRGWDWQAFWATTSAIKTMMSRHETLVLFEQESIYLNGLAQSFH